MAVVMCGLVCAKVVAFATLPSMCFVPMLYIVRIMIRSGVRLITIAVESEQARSDANLDRDPKFESQVGAGVAAVVLAAFYIARAFVVVTLLKPDSLKYLSVDTVGSRINLPAWHKLLEMLVGPQSVWDEVGTAASNLRKRDGDDIGDNNLTVNTFAALTGSRAEPPRSSSSSQSASEQQHGWADRFGNYLLNSNAPYTWYGFAQATPLFIITALSAVCSATTKSHAGANAVCAALAVLFVISLVAMRPFPAMHGLYWWFTAVVGGAALAVAFALNSANEYSMADALSGASDTLGKAVVIISIIVFVLVIVGTCLVALRALVLRFPNSFGTQKVTIVTLLGGRSSANTASDGSRYVTCRSEGRRLRMSKTIKQHTQHTNDLPVCPLCHASYLISNTASNRTRI